MSWRSRTYKDAYLRSIEITGRRALAEAEAEDEYVRDAIWEDDLSYEVRPDMDEIRSCLLMCLLRNLGLTSPQRVLNNYGCDW